MLLVSDLFLHYSASCLLLLPFRPHVLIPGYDISASAVKEPMVKNMCHLHFCYSGNAEELNVFSLLSPDSLPAFPIAMVAGIVIGTVTGLTLLISIVVCLVMRKNNSKKRYSG